MSYGLEVYDSTGTQVLATTDRLGRLHSTHSIPGLAVNTSYTVSIPEYRADGNWAPIVRDLVLSSGQIVSLSHADGSVTIRANNNNSSPLLLEILKVG